MTKLSTTIQDSIEACKKAADMFHRASDDHHKQAFLDAASRLEAIRELAKEIVLHDRSITAIYYREKLKSLL